jgi:glycerol-3-phosphate acyltransferase PlsY
MELGVLALVGVYLLGAIPFGVIVSRLRGVDVRQVGSGNIGATNVGRALGLRWAALVLVLDAAKGLLAVALIGWLFAGHPAHARWVALAMLVAVCGHVYSIFLRFRGGKGVATALGVMLAACPVAALWGAAAYGVVLAWKRVSAWGSLAGVTAGLCWVWIGATPRPIAIAFTVIAALIVARHRDNLRASARGT